MPPCVAAACLARASHGKDTISYLQFSHQTAGFVIPPIIFVFENMDVCVQPTNHNFPAASELDAKLRVVPDIGVISLAGGCEQEQSSQPHNARSPLVLLCFIRDHSVDYESFSQKVYGQQVVHAPSNPWTYFPRPTRRECCRTSSFFASGEPCSRD
jgi:hypothetical protein